MIAQSLLSLMFVALPCWWDGPFDDAALAPSSARMYVHVSGAGEIRRELADRPVWRWISAVAATGEIEQAWNSLARAASVSPEELFDGYLGGKVTLVVDGDEANAGGWAMVAMVDAERGVRLLKALNVKVLSPEHGAAMHELPEHDLLIARTKGRLVIGPREKSGLLRSLLANLERAGDGAAGLSGDLIVREAKALGDGQVGMFVRHGEPLGGSSAFVANLQGDRLTVKHVANFDVPPFSSPATTTKLDLALVDRLQSRCVVAVTEPAANQGLVETYLAMQLGQATLLSKLQGNLGPMQVTTIGEGDGRLHEPPFDGLYPTLARVYEVKDLQKAAGQIDEQLLVALDRMQEMGRGRYVMDVPAMEELPGPGEARCVDVSPAAEWFTGGLPGSGSMRLCWQVVERPEENAGQGDVDRKNAGAKVGGWVVVATSDDHLKDVVRALRRDGDGAGADRVEGKTVAVGVSAGTVQGQRLAKQLENLAEHSAKWFEQDAVEDFRATLLLMSQLADGVTVCSWQLQRPSENRMRLDMQMQLAPPASARPQR